MKATDMITATDIPAVETVINKRKILNSEPASEYGAGFLYRKMHTKTENKKD